MTRNISNFAIGCFASLCAVFIPRMLTMLNGNSDLQLFNSHYISVGIVFALIIGGVTAIFEQKKNRPAAETFMSALGIPALLAGALNIGTASTELQNSAISNQKLVETIQKQYGIAEDSASITPLEPLPDNSHSRFEFFIIPSAYADDNGNAVIKTANEGNDRLNLGIQVEQAPYVVVLGKTTDRAAALKKAEAIRKFAPQAEVVQSNQDYLVIDSTEKRSKSDALLNAIDIKNRSNLKPYLLQVK